MALTTQEVNEAAKWLGKQMYVDTDKTATLTKTDLEAAVQSLEDGMETLFSAIPGAWDTKTVKEGLIDNMPEPFQTESTASEKALALTAWALKAGGLI